MRFVFGILFILLSLNVSAKSSCQDFFNHLNGARETFLVSELSKKPYSFGPLFSESFIVELFHQLKTPSQNPFSEVITLKTNPIRLGQLSPAYKKSHRIIKSFDEMGEVRTRSISFGEAEKEALQPYKDKILAVAEEILNLLKKSTGDELLKVNLVEIRRSHEMNTMGGYIEHLPMKNQRPHLDEYAYEKFTIIGTLPGSDKEAVTHFYPEGYPGPAIKAKVNEFIVFNGQELLHSPPMSLYKNRAYIVINIGHYFAMMSRMI